MYERRSPARSTSPIPRSNPNATHNSTRSPTKYHTQPDEDLTMRRCKNILSHADLDILLNELSRKRTQLVSCLQVYDLLRTNGLPQRCTVHNNTISLFCLNEKRLLCVNCVYGAHKHRTHRVCPVKDCISDISRDGEKTQQDLEKQFVHIRNQEATAESNLGLLENSLNEMLLKLDQEFDDISKQLTDKYLDLKKSLMECYHELITKHRKVLQEFAWLHGTTQSTLSHTRNHSEVEEEEVRRYWLRQKFIESVGLRVKPFKKQQLEMVSREMYKEIRRIRQTIEKQKWVKL